MEGPYRLGEAQAAIPSGRSVTEPALSRCVATERKDRRPTGTVPVGVHALYVAEVVSLKALQQAPTTAHAARAERTCRSEGNRDPEKSVAGRSHIKERWL